MVLIKNFRTEFYERIRSQRILVLVSLDVDALCALKILQYLFQCDHVMYTILPVAGRQDLESAFVENSESCKTVLLINCGGNIDIVELLQPDEDVMFYICDSHRPIHVHNIYNVKQVNLVMKDDLINVPDFDDIFMDDSEDEQDSDSESEPSNKRTRMTEETLMKRREKRAWDQKRAQILLEYSEFTTYGQSAAVSMFELAWKMTKDTNDLLWFATIGLTDQYIHQKISREQYIESVSLLQPHVSRHNHKIDDDENKRSVSSLKITFEEELQLCLYRHWTLFDSLCNSPLTASRFRVWSMKGKKKLQEFLADMGLSLVQCKQMYTSMDSSLRASLREMIEGKAEKYGLSIQDILVPSFLAEYGYKRRLSAMDVAYSCAALLESIDKNKSVSDCFLQAQDLLMRDNNAILDKGLDFAKTQLKATMSQVQSFLDMSQIISAGPFLYAFVGEGVPDVKLFSKPICLQRLAKFTLTAYCSVSKSRRAPNLPLVLGAPRDLDQGTTLIIGIPPLSEEDGRNFFGQAFEHAAKNTNSRILQDSFDSHIAEMKTEDKSKFFDALIALMQ